MIGNNTLATIAVGAGLIGFVYFMLKVWNKKPLNSEGWAALFGVTGTIMAVMGFATTIMWPYGADVFAYANIAFGEPSAAFGMLMLLASVYLWRNRKVYGDTTAKGLETMQATTFNVFRPVSVFIFITGLAMAAIAISWLRFQNGTAPVEEPITGLFHDMPLFESVFLFGLWGTVAAGCLAFPFTLSKKAKSSVKNFVITMWLVGGIGFAGFGALNYYTHIGMYTNLSTGTEYRI